MLDFPQTAARLRRKSQLLGIEKFSGLSGVLGGAGWCGERLGVVQGGNLGERMWSVSGFQGSTLHSHWAPLLSADFAVFSPELVLTDDRSGRIWNCRTFQNFYRQRGFSTFKVVIKELHLIELVNISPIFGDTPQTCLINTRLHARPYIEINWAEPLTETQPGQILIGLFQQFR